MFLFFVFDNTIQSYHFFHSQQHGLAVPPTQCQQCQIWRLRGRVRGNSGQDIPILVSSDESFFSQDIQVDWAPERVVYKHTWKDRWGWDCLLKIVIFGCRYIFWNKGGIGWAIGSPESLEYGGTFYMGKFRFRKIPLWTKVWIFSGKSDAQEPWQDVWLKGVTVNCSSNGQQKSGKRPD